MFVFSYILPFYFALPIICIVILIPHYTVNLFATEKPRMIPIWLNLFGFCASGVLRGNSKIIQPEAGCSYLFCLKWKYRSEIITLYEKWREITVFKNMSTQREACVDRTSEIRYNYTHRLRYKISPEPRVTGEYLSNFKLFTNTDWQIQKGYWWQKK